MTEDERQNLLGTVVEANTGLSEVAFKLRRELTPKAPALKTAIKAERETFRLKQELQRLDIEDLEPAKRRESLPEVRRSGKVVDMEQLRRRSTLEWPGPRWHSSAAEQELDGKRQRPGTRAGERIVVGEVGVLRVKRVKRVSAAGFNVAHH